MAKAVASSLNGAGVTWGTYASVADVVAPSVPVVVTFQPDPKNQPHLVNK